MKTMYEVNWHRNGDHFSHCTVSPITVVWEGIRPGCSGVSITARDSEGREFVGSPRDYFETEAAAWADTVEGLTNTLDSLLGTQAKTATEIAAIQAFLGRLSEAAKATS